MTTRTPVARSRVRRWALPALLALLGVALLAAGDLGVSAARTSYDTALAHDCTAGGCSSIGPLGQQPDYLEGEIAVAAGVIALGVALLAAFRARDAGGATRASGPA